MGWGEVDGGFATVTLVMAASMDGFRLALGENLDVGALRARLIAIRAAAMARDLRL